MSFPLRQLALAACCFASFAVSVRIDAQPASPWAVRVWTGHGLDDRAVVGVGQAGDGFLWLATPRKIARFDGERFEEFPLRDVAAVRDRRIRVLLGARDGTIWVVTDGTQLIHFASNGTTVLTRPLPRASVQSVVEDKDGAFWISFDHNRTAVCRVKDGVVTTFDERAGFTDGRCVLACDAAGRIWFLQDSELGVFRDGRAEKLGIRIPSSGRLLGAKDGGLWIAASNGIFRYRLGGTLQRLDGQNGPPFTALPSAMLEDRSGALWIGTMPDGLFRFTVADGLEAIATSYPEINGLAEDREGNIWVGTAGGGLNRVSPRAITFEGDATGLPQYAIQTVCQDRDGKMWGSTQNGTLVERTPDGHWATQPKWPTAITCLEADPNGGIWIGTRKRALYRLKDGSLETWTPETGLAAHTVGVIVAGRDGTVWLAGEGPTTLQSFRDGVFTQLPLPSYANRIEMMTADANGRIWLGLDEGGLLRVDGDKVVEQTPPAAPHLALRGLYATSDGVLWLGYRGGGIGRLQNGRFTHVGTEDGLYSNSIAHLISDERGWLWCGGEDGVFRVRLQELTDFANHRASWVQSVHYGEEAGLPDLQVTAKAWGKAIRSRDGRIWIPMGPALVIADPSRVHENLGLPPVFLTKVRVDGALVADYRGLVQPVKPPDTVAALPLAQALKLAAVHQKLEFDFTALSFAAPENVEFRYRLEPLDQDWVVAGPARTASYLRIPAGSYRFRVQACNSDGLWNEAGTTLPVVIAPFAWQTWWFRGLALLGFTAVTTAVVRRVSHRRLQRKVQVLQQQMLVERERSRIARDLHDDAGNRLTRIALLSRLALRDQIKPEKAALHLEQLSAAAREATDAFDEIVWAVNPSNDNLAELIGYLAHFANQLCEAAGIKCVLDVPMQVPERSLATDVRHNLFLATKEAAHNVVRHAKATELRLAVTVTAVSLTIVVMDNGRGLSSGAFAPGADGMKNFKQRMDEIGGRFTVESAANQGTRLTFSYSWAAAR